MFSDKIFSKIIVVENSGFCKMKLEPRQFLQQRQELQLSLFQTQSLQILQMPTTELVQYIQNEAEKNPYLELEFKSMDTEDEGSIYTDFDEPEQNSVEIINENITLPKMKEKEFEIKDEEIEGDEIETETWDRGYNRAGNFTDLSYNPDIYEWVESKFYNIRGNETLKSHLIKQLN